MNRILYRRFEDGSTIPDGVTVLSAWLREGGGIDAIVLEEDIDNDGVLKHHHDCDEHDCCPVPSALRAELDLLGLVEGTQGGEDD